MFSIFLLQRLCHIELHADQLKTALYQYILCTNLVYLFVTELHTASQSTGFKGNEVSGTKQQISWNKLVNQIY